MVIRLLYTQGMSHGRVVACLQAVPEVPNSVNAMLDAELEIVPYNLDWTICIFLSEGGNSLRGCP